MSANFFSTARLDIRAMRLDDAGDLLALYSDAEVVRYIGGERRLTLESQRERIAEILERDSQWHGRFGVWAAVERSSGTAIGAWLCKPAPDAKGEPSDTIEIGWHLRRSVWGKGFASEMAVGGIADAFGRVGLRQVIAVVDPGNRRSQRLARRLGMMHRGRTDAFYGGKELELFDLERR